MDLAVANEDSGADCSESFHGNGSCNDEACAEEEKTSVVGATDGEEVITNPAGGEPQHISKNELKRRAKMAKFEIIKKERRAREREKKKLRQRGPGEESRSTVRKKLKQATMATSSCKTAVVIDMSLEEHMDDRSLNKCVKQVARCYSINRRAVDPVQFHVTSLDGRGLAAMKKNAGYIHWDVHFSTSNFGDVFDKSRIVYLTSESDTVLEKLVPEDVYVIGGLVDHNHNKGLCHRLAVEKDLRHARLPLSEYLDMKTRKVLTIDHVFHILVNMCNGHSWKETFLQVLPARKGAKGHDDDDDDSDSVDGKN